MSQQFVFQSLPAELIFSVMGFLDSFSVFRMERLNTKFYKSLTRNKLVDRLIYGNLVLNEVQLLPTWWKYSSESLIGKLYEKNNDWKNWLNRESMLDLLLDDKNGRFRILLRNFYLAPFEIVQGNVEGKYSTDASRAYSTVGGVVEFTKWKPCGLIEKLLQNFKSTEYFQAKIHSMLMFCSICDWFLDNNEINTFRLTMKDNSVVSKLPGEFVLSYVKDEMKNVKIINNLTRYAIDFEIFRLDRSKYDTCSVDTIFNQTRNPPYGMKPNAATVVESFKTELFEIDSYSLDWSKTITSNPWSSYWSSGLEWWGCYAMTSFNSKECAFIVATASCSD